MPLLDWIDRWELHRAFLMLDHSGYAEVRRSASWIDSLANQRRGGIFFFLRRKQCAKILSPFLFHHHKVRLLRFVQFHCAATRAEAPKFESGKRALCMLTTSSLSSNDHIILFCCVITLKFLQRAQSAAAEYVIIIITRSPLAAPFGRGDKTFVLHVISAGVVTAVVILCLIALKLPQSARNAISCFERDARLPWLVWCGCLALAFFRSFQLTSDWSWVLWFTSVFACAICLRGAKPSTNDERIFELRRIRCCEARSFELFVFVVCRWSRLVCLSWARLLSQMEMQLTAGGILLMVCFKPSALA